MMTPTELEQVARQIGDEAAALAKRAHEHGLGALAYLLDMVVYEAGGMPFKDVGGSNVHDMLRKR